MVVSLKKVRSISRIRSKNFGKRSSSTAPSSSPSATYNEVVSRYDYAHLALGKKEQQQIAFNLSTVSSLDNIHELETRYPASEDQRRREAALDEDNRSCVSIDDALSYSELGYGYKTNLGPTNLWQLAKKDKDMNNDAAHVSEKSTQSTMGFIHAVQRMVDCVSCSDASNASSKCEDASTKNSLEASQPSVGPPLQPTMSYISEGDLPTQDSQPIGGPKYYIVMNSKTRESKVYHENMPRKGDLFDVPEERGYEVLEYGFFGQKKE